MFYVNFRRRVEFDLVESPLLELSDDDLLELVRQLQQDNPDVGESMAVGFVRSRGFRVSRARIRTALRASDLLSTALRWPGVITRRRVYSVAGPNSLWHIGMLVKSFHKSNTNQVGTQTDCAYSAHQYNYNR